MPEAATMQPDHAARIAKALGVPVAGGGGGDGLVVVNDLTTAAELAGKKGAILFLPGDQPREIREIVVCLDGTGAAETVLPLAVKLSQAEAASVRLLVPKGKTYLTGTPIDRYLKVLVNTMREQHVSVSGEVVDDDLLAAAGAAAKKSDGMIAGYARGFEGLNKLFFSGDAVSKLQGAPLLLYSPR